MMRNENMIKPQNQQSCQTSVTSSADYKGYKFDEDNTGYAPKHLRFSFYTDDGENISGSGESIEDCKQQIDNYEKNT
jgi:hypothetical protein